MIFSYLQDWLLFWNSDNFYANSHNFFVKSLVNLLML